MVGWDRNFNYYKLQYGLTCLLENEDCLFIATNTDVRSDPNLLCWMMDRVSLRLRLTPDVFPAA